MLKSVRKTFNSVLEKDEEINTEGHYTKIGARVYDAYYGNMDGGSWVEEKEEVLDDIVDEDTEKVLCLGCGGGRSVDYLDSKYDLELLYGLDYSEEMVSLARERTSDSATIIKGDFTNLDRLDEKFDLVYMFGCPINHYKETEINNIIDSISSLTQGTFAYDFSSTKAWDEKGVGIGRAFCDEFRLTRASCVYNTFEDNFYEEEMYMSYMIEKGEKVNTVNINNIKLYSHSREKHEREINRKGRVNSITEYDDGRFIINASI